MWGRNSRTYPGGLSATGAERGRERESFPGPIRAGEPGRRLVTGRLPHSVSRRASRRRSLRRSPPSCPRQLYSGRRPSLFSTSPSSSASAHRSRSRWRGRRRSRRRCAACGVHYLPSRTVCRLCMPCVRRSASPAARTAAPSALCSGLSAAAPAGRRRTGTRRRRPCMISAPTSLVDS